MTTPIASIIILIYNQEKSVAKAIDSVLAQKTSYPFEIILADDCSSDSSRAICEMYAEEYPQTIRLMPQMPNKGVVGNYFDAVEACRGKYISDCAGDDFWVATDLLQKEIQLLEKNPNISIVFPDVTVNDQYLHSEKEEYQKWMKENVPGRELLEGMFRHTNSLPYQLSASLYRKDIVMDALQNHPEIIRIPECGVEDLPLMLLLASKGDASYLPIVGYHYTIDETQQTLTTNNTPRKDFDFYSRIMLVEPRLAAYYGVDLRQLREHFDKKMDYITSMARKTRDKKYTLPIIKKISKLWPLPLSIKSRINILLIHLLP